MTTIARGGVLALFFIAALVLALGIVKVDVHKAGAHHEFDPNCLTHPQTYSGFLWCPNGPQSHETPRSAPGEDPPPPDPVQVRAPAPPPTTEDPPPATEDPPPTTVPPPPGPRVEWNGVFMDLSEFLCFQDAAKNVFHDTLESTGCSGA